MLEPMKVAARAARLSDSLEESGLDAFGVTSLTNVRWLTGFTGSNAAALLGPDGLVVFTDGRYADQAPAELEAAGVEGDVVIGADVVAGLADACADHWRVGLEADDLSWTQQRRLTELTEVELVPTTDTIAMLRAVKDSGELARMGAAAAIVDTALASVRPLLGTAPTERDVALALDHAFAPRERLRVRMRRSWLAGPMPRSRMRGRPIGRSPTATS